VYGSSHSGKTTWWGTLAEKLFYETGKKTRLYVGDSSIVTVNEMGLTEIGAVEAFQFTDREYPLSVIKLITQGYWPENPNDPKSKLLPTKDWSNIGMVVFEGLTVVATYIMGSTIGGLADRAAKGEKLGQDSPFVVMEASLTGNKDESLRFGANNMAHYAFAQSRIKDAIISSKSIPVPIVYWTAHERDSEDKYNGNEKLIGPDAAGKALTPQIPLWFGNCIHLTNATKRVKQKDLQTGRDIDQLLTERRAYLREHCDPDGLTSVKYVAGSRCPLVKDEKGNWINPLPEYLSPPDPLEFYRRLAEARKKRREQMTSSVGG
jgi:hypothetical protein